MTGLSIASFIVGVSGFICGIAFFIKQRRQSQSLGNEIRQVIRREINGAQKTIVTQVEDAIRYGPTILFAEADILKQASDMVRRALSQLESLREAHLAELKKLVVKGSIKSYSIYEKDLGALPPEEQAILSDLKSRGLVIEEPFGVPGAGGYDEYAYGLTEVGRIVYQLSQGSKGG